MPDLPNLPMVYFHGGYGEITKAELQDMLRPLPDHLQEDLLLDVDVDVNGELCSIEEWMGVPKFQRTIKEIS